MSGSAPEGGSGAPQMDQDTDRAHFSPALFGFYGFCAMVSIGAAVFFFAFFVLTKPAYGALPIVMKIVGGLFMVVGIPGCFLCLGKARSKGHEVARGARESRM